MFWADRIADEVVARYGKSGNPILIRDEKTASGQVHVGSLRSAALHAAVAEVLEERGVGKQFLFEINDFDPMDGLPSYLDASVYEKYLGMPLLNIPSPGPSASNFAEYYGQEYVGVLNEIGFNPEVYRGSELYKTGRMNEAIKMALEKRDVIRTIYKEESGGERAENWYPLNVICEKCGKVSTTSVTGFDGEKVTYICRENAVEWTKGCNHEGEVSPFDGNAKLPWKVEWAAKFKVLGVQFEGAGKDHYTRGGSRQVADRISREVFLYEPPYGVGNEFFLVGGAKMSSSKGNAASARGIADLLPPHILRFLLYKSEITRQINFDPEGDTIPVLFDHYDKYAEKFWTGVQDDETRIFDMVHRNVASATIEKRFLPRFSQVAFLVQMPHLDPYKELEVLKGEVLTELDKSEFDMRADYAKRWLKDYAADEFKFELQTTLPAKARELSQPQKQILATLAERITASDQYDGLSLHTLLHGLREESGMSPKELFAALYIVFLGKESGPKAGWFLSTLEKDFVISRLREAST